MTSWQLDITIGQFFLDFAWIGVLLVIATYLRRHVRVFQDFLIPNNLIAGFIGLFIGMNGIGLVDLTTERLGAYVYHLLALMFIAIGLRAPNKKAGMSSVKFGMIFIMVYLVQALAGMFIAFLLIYTFMPDLFAGIGLLPPLAFGMNPGIAFSIGQNWELYGFESGAVVGLTFAAIGFLFAYTVGIIIVKRGIQKGDAAFHQNSDSITNDIRTGIITKEIKPSGGVLTTSSEAIESLTLHLSIVGLTYILTWLALSGMEYLLISFGAENEVSTLWSFHFIAAAITALIVRKLMDIVNIGSLIDDTTMTRSANFFMDIMIVASVAAISWAVIQMYIIPLILMSLVVLITTWATIFWACKTAFIRFRFERFVAIFGNLTGTIQSALVLLRVLDPELKSPVSYNLVYGSGLALAFGFPLLILINAPVHYFEDILTGFWFVTFGLFAYLLLILFGWNFLKGKS
jgi:glutamate:Na+ symporter, ESS family